MIVSIVFDWRGRRLGYVRAVHVETPTPGRKRFTHELAKAAGYDSISIAKKKLPKLEHGERVVYAERYSIKEAQQLRDAA